MKEWPKFFWLGVSAAMFLATAIAHADAGRPLGALFFGAISVCVALWASHEGRK